MTADDYCPNHEFYRISSVFVSAGEGTLIEDKEPTIRVTVSLRIRFRVN